jgi:hypothetical protein
MKIKIILVMFLTAVPVFSEELTELQKVDQRLEELKTIWKQDTAIINNLTNFKRTPVQEGTQAYFKCLEASKRIQQAEAEAKTLKARKNILENQSTDPNIQSPNAGTANGPIRPTEIPKIEYLLSKHGPKIKGLFVGMGIIECKKRVFELAAMCDSKRIVGENSDPRLSTVEIVSAVSKDRLEQGFTSTLFSITADSNGIVTSIGFRPDTTKALFKAESLSFADFIKNFENAYNVSLESRIDQTDASLYAMTVTSQGVKIYVSSGFEIIISKTIAPNETKKAFD